MGNLLQVLRGLSEVQGDAAAAGTDPQASVRRRLGQRLRLQRALQPQTARGRGVLRFQTAHVLLRVQVRERGGAGTPGAAGERGSSHRRRGLDVRDLSACR